MSGIAAQHGRSTEAEIHEIVVRSVHPERRLCIGTELRRYAEQIGGVKLEIRRDI